MSLEALSICLTCLRAIYVHQLTLHMIIPFLQRLCLSKVITQPHSYRRRESRESKFIELSFAMADIAEGKAPIVLR